MLTSVYLVHDLVLSGKQELIHFILNVQLPVVNMILSARNAGGIAHVPIVVCRILKEQEDLFSINGL